MQFFFSILYPILFLMILFLYLFTLTDVLIMIMIMIGMKKNFDKINRISFEITIEFDSQITNWIEFEIRIFKILQYILQKFKPQIVATCLSINLKLMIIIKTVANFMNRKITKQNHNETFTLSLSLSFCHFLFDDNVKEFRFVLFCFWRD